MKKLSEAGYNERLFQGGLRRRFHMARFEWLEQALKRHTPPPRSVIELGCFDGRALEHVPGPDLPARYLGLDANWEGGLDLARERFAGRAGYTLEECTTPAGFLERVGDEHFDLGLCLETLEHVPPDMLEGYVDAFARCVRGVFAVTVPNEKGLVFLAKHMAKRLFGDVEDWKAREVLDATLGRMDRVERNEHKGFDYETVIRHVGSRFDLLEITGYPLTGLPRSLGVGIGIVGRSRG